MNNEIDPKLKKELNHLQDVPERGLQTSHAGRESFLIQAKSLKPRPVSVKKPVRTSGGFRRRSLAFRLASILGVLMFTLASLGGTAYAAQSSGPDDLLYGVKTLTEEIQVVLETDPEDKLDLYVAFASRRLQEIQAQVDAGEEISEKALELLEKHTQKMLEQAAKLDEKGIQSALLQIEENLQKQNQMMTEMGKEHPQGGPPGLLKAQEKIQERLELVENGKEEPQGFRDTIKERKEKPDNPGQEKKDGNENSNKPEIPPGQENSEPGSLDVGEGMPGSENGSGPGGR